uniref:Uncharacterized protein n=1 Tax=Phaeomonas parva TaxID=124430 RepID=A0A7S1TQ12_9STRA|mmetsp:Transcript_12539/g.37722  ORF Transcript_12539/g.37722 Transcript_12539/m.37722 type:complete len:236 (+) Transcript_12539:201-908(+)
MAPYKGGRRRSAGKMRVMRYELPAPLRLKVEKLLERSVLEEMEGMSPAERKVLRPLAKALSASLLRKITLNADVVTPSAPAGDDKGGKQMRAHANAVGQLLRQIALMQDKLRAARSRAAQAQAKLLEPPEVTPAAETTAEGDGGDSPVVAPELKAGVEQGLTQLNEHFVGIQEKLETLEDQQPKRFTDLSTTVDSVRHLYAQERNKGRMAASDRAATSGLKAGEATSALAAHLQL